MEPKPTIDRNEPVAIPDTNQPPADAVEPQTEETPATEETSGEEESENSSSQEDTTDYDSLIEAERNGGKPDPVKAKERFERKRAEQAQQSDESDEPAELDDDERPLTRKEAQSFLAQERQRIVNEANAERIIELAHEYADNDRQAEFILEVHRNRIYPEGMSLRDQLAEAKAVADYKRIQVKSVEMGRKIASQQNASRNTASTQRDPQPALAPNIAGDMKASLQRAGYTFNNQTRRYEKTLPNGKLLVTPDGKNPQLVG